MFQCFFLYIIFPTDYIYHSVPCSLLFYNIYWQSFHVSSSILSLFFLTSAEPSFLRLYDGWRRENKGRRRGVEKAKAMPCCFGDIPTKPETRQSGKGQVGASREEGHVLGSIVFSQLTLKLSPATECCLLSMTECKALCALVSLQMRRASIP